MAVFVEDPLMRIVNVNWKQGGGPPDPQFQRCGTYSWTRTIGYSDSGNLVTLRTPDDPMLIRGPDPYEAVYAPDLVFITRSGLRLGYGYIPDITGPPVVNTQVIMSSTKYKIHVDYPVNAQNEGEIHGFAITHLGGPDDPATGNAYKAKPPPFIEFQGSVDWEYDIAKQPIYGADGNYENGRFDPAFGGPIWLQTFSKRIVGGGPFPWEYESWFMQDEPTVEVHLGGDTNNQYEGTYVVGQVLTITIEGECTGGETNPPLIIYTR
jgi:hypothetical protein